MKVSDSVRASDIFAYYSGFSVPRGGMHGYFNSIIRCALSHGVFIRTRCPLGELLRCAVRAVAAERAGGGSDSSEAALIGGRWPEALSTARFISPPNSLFLSTYLPLSLLVP